jgi:uncharacterized membrane protein YpjA
VKNKNLIIIWYGFLSWLIPFVASFLFFNQSGQVTIDEALFKSIMVVVGMLTAVILLLRYFKNVKLGKDLLKEGLIVGIAWYVINGVLDYVTLVTVFKMPLLAWIYGIGVRYLAIPIVSVGMALSKKK